MAKPASKLHSEGRLWAVLNSPLALLLMSGMLLGGGAKIYADRQSALAELDTRRAAYVEMLAEYQRRVSLLSHEDARLEPFIGTADEMLAGRVRPLVESKRCQFETLSKAVGEKQEDILLGRGSYKPTAPIFSELDILTLAARMEQTAGVPDIQLGGLRLIRTLDAPPEILWIMVRSYLPMLKQFGVSRHMLNVNGELPLIRGQQLTDRQERVLGFLELKPSDVDRALHRARRKSDELNAKLRETSAENDDVQTCDDSML